MSRQKIFPQTFFQVFFLSWSPENCLVGDFASCLKFFQFMTSSILSASPPNTPCRVADKSGCISGQCLSAASCCKSWCNLIPCGGTTLCPSCCGSDEDILWSSFVQEASFLFFIQARVVDAVHLYWPHCGLHLRDFKETGKQEAYFLLCWHPCLTSNGPIWT